MGSHFTRKLTNGKKVIVAQATPPGKPRITRTFSSKIEALQWIASVEHGQDVDLPTDFETTVPRCKRPADAMQTTNLSVDSGDSAESDGHFLVNTGLTREIVSENGVSVVTLRLVSSNSLTQTADPQEYDTLSEVIDRYVREIMPGKRSVRAPLQQLEFWRAQLGFLPINQVTPALIAKAKSLLLTEKTKHGTERKPSTINRYLAILAHVFTIAMKEWFLIESNPVHRVRKCKEPQGRTVFLSRAEHALMLKVLRLETPIMQTVVKIALYTGMRQGEIMGLKWRNVDLSGARIRLETSKNGKPRSIPLVGEALNAMIGWATLRPGGPEDLLFPSEEVPDKPLDIRKGWLRIQKRIKMPHLHFHDLRHTTASYMAMSGATPQEIADVLGHRTLQMVKRYAHLADGHSRTALDRMANSLAKDEEEQE